MAGNTWGSDAMEHVREAARLATDLDRLCENKTFVVTTK